MIFMSSTFLARCRQGTRTSESIKPLVLARVSEIRRRDPARQAWRRPRFRGQWPHRNVVQYPRRPCSCLPHALPSLSPATLRHRIAGAHAARPQSVNGAAGGRRSGGIPPPASIASRRRARRRDRGAGPTPPVSAARPEGGRSGLPSGARGPRRRGSHSSIRRATFEVRVSLLGG